LGQEPYLAPNKFELHLEPSYSNNPTFVSVTYQFTNYGPGPAVIEHAAVICEVTEALKQPPSYSGALLEWTAIGQILGSNESTVTLSAASKPATDATGASNVWTFLEQFQPSRAFFYGEVFYNDLAGNGYVSGFAIIWDRERNRMRLATGQEAPGYNYRYGSRSVRRAPFWKRWRSHPQIWGPTN
jgi:hypothetical protein